MGERSRYEDEHGVLLPRLLDAAAPHPSDSERPPHVHDWTAGTAPGPWPGMPSSTCIAPGHSDIERTPRTEAVRFDLDDAFWQDWFRNWFLYGTVYAINNPEPRVVPAETLTIHEGPCAIEAESERVSLDVERLREALEHILWRAGSQKEIMETARAALSPSTGTPEAGE